MVRREFCYLSTWITISRANKVRPRITRTLKVIGSSQIPSIGLLVTFLRAEICSLLLISAYLPILSWAAGCQELAADAVHSTLDWQMNMMYLYTVFTLILSVIIPHTKHANSLAIAATATFLALPCLINL